MYEDDEKVDKPRFSIEPKQDSLRAVVELVNVAEQLTEDELVEIGAAAKAGYEYDLSSRVDWENALDDWLKLAGQIRENRTWPWPNASNVKYPLLSTAAMQFAARAYPSLVPSNGEVVKSIVIGPDPDGQKLELAQRVDTYMSYQIMHEMHGWEEDMDRLLIMLPVVGTMFKKTYWDPITEQNCSKLVLPKNLVVNYWTRCLETSERISERIEMSQRQVEERMRSGLYLDLDLAPPNLPEAQQPHRDGSLLDPGAVDCTTPYVIIEQHSYLDLDRDGYKEPYIITFELDSGKVLRITARYDESTMYFNDEGDLLKIEPIQYYTKFGFVPNPDGSFYDIGFGTLLGPINESVNTLINQLTDAGTLNNLQSGFLGKTLRLRMGEAPFKPGEWKGVNATGDDLRKQIIPLPTKEPSNVLFQLMGALVTSGKELASVAEIFTGKMPGQNTPATTTMATVEQGMKVFTAVYKRIFRSLDSEFKKLFKLNATYLNPETYQAVSGVTVNPTDFQENTYRICPGADPTAVAQSEKLMKAQGLLELLSIAGPILNPVEIVKRVLEAQEQPNLEMLLAPQVAETGELPPPPPDPKLQEMQMKAQMDAQAAQQKMVQSQQQHELKQRGAETQLAMKAQQQALDQEHAARMAQIDEARAIHNQGIFAAESRQKLVMQAAEGQQKLAQQRAEGAAKAENIRKQAVAKPKAKPSKGAK